MLFKLQRLSIEEDGAFGILTGPKAGFILTTLEPTYELQTKIPQGTFLCTRTTFFKKGYSTYEILVPGHSRLLFHKGNLEEDSEGCILVGQKFGWLRGKRAVLQSAAGFSQFMASLVSYSTFVLNVENFKVR